ncbi:hypothetical protein [Aliarcobacter thereius]|uniref:Uncharacterized protein n=1 Tax=Aliarcobacter thereius LMG 24486 TaxID=1032240 RepID=A0A1C7WV05_9BACT|nr:hypothetical protein [Aliarcobacter thereius]OCL96272.1 hypothetical protein AA347_01763 [Aliarcobacter thereius LMG 24486]QBF15765.1 hypothetical protein ATH_0692 [Aliarcobacter thereius LMG 24486]TLS92456.1 hypothetical protein FE244_05845 [Aliarcobacter thereius]
MSSKKFLKIVLGLSFFVAVLIGGVNYVVDPYGIYKTNIFQNKPEQDKNIRLAKVVKVEELKPVSISLGTSRTEYGYDPNHEYFSKPSYNLAVSGASLYENRLYLEHAIKQGNLKEVILVADWRMFNDSKMRKLDDFEDSFNIENIYKQLFSVDLFRSSFKTIINQKSKSSYLENGQRDWYFDQENIDKKGGHLKVMNKDEESYYKKSDFKYNSNIYQDTKESSFDDFRKILELCYQNNIKLDIVFGPSHIRQWEAFDYYQDIETWYKWKKDVVLFVEKIAKEQQKTPYRIMDFSVYHELTAETVPTNPKEKMKYHWEASHYKKELGDIVLDRLLDISPYKDFGVELNIQNIDNHIQKLRDDRVKFIDTEAYRKEVFEE